MSGFNAVHGSLAVVWQDNIGAAREVMPASMGPRLARRGMDASRRPQWAGSKASMRSTARSPWYG